MIVRNLDNLTTMNYELALIEAFQKRTLYDQLLNGKAVTVDGVLLHLAKLMFFIVRYVKANEREIEIIDLTNGYDVIERDELLATVDDEAEITKLAYVDWSQERGVYVECLAVELVRYQGKVTGINDDAFDSSKLRTRLQAHDWGVDKASVRNKHTLSIRRKQALLNKRTWSAAGLASATASKVINSSDSLFVKAAIDCLARTRSRRGRKRNNGKKYRDGREQTCAHYDKEDDRMESFKEPGRRLHYAVEVQRR